MPALPAGGCSACWRETAWQEHAEPVPLWQRRLPQCPHPGARSRGTPGQAGLKGLAGTLAARGRATPEGSGHQPRWSGFCQIGPLVGDRDEHFWAKPSKRARQARPACTPGSEPVTVPGGSGAAASLATGWHWRASAESGAPGCSRGSGSRSGSGEAPAPHGPAAPDTSRDCPSREPVTNPQCGCKLL